MEPYVIRIEYPELLSVLVFERSEEEPVAGLCGPASLLYIFHASCDAVEQGSGLDHLAAVVCVLPSVYLATHVHVVHIQPVLLVQQALLGSLVKSLGHIEIVLILGGKV